MIPVRCLFLAAASLALVPSCKNGKPDSASTSVEGASAGAPSGASGTQPAAGKAAGGDPGDGSMVVVGSGGAVKVLPGDGKVVAESDSYTVTLATPAKVAAGAEASTTIEIHPKEGWKLNREFPTKLVIGAPSDVKVTKGEQTVADAVVFDEKTGRWAVQYAASAAGDKSFTCKMKFAVCTDTTCDPKKEELAWNVAVE